MRLSYRHNGTMKNKLILLALCILAPVLAQAEDHARGGHHGPDSPLGLQMQSMAKSMRQLGAQINDSAKRDSALQTIASIKKNAETAKTLEPAKAKTVAAVDQSKFMEDYHKQMDELLGQINKLADAVRAGNTQEANKIFSGFRNIKREGHQAFAADND
jgi:soluble cytochrome b562